MAVRAEVPVVKQTGWWVSASSTKKVCATFGGACGFVEAVAAHVALAEAADAMGIDGQDPALKMARGAADLAQGDLQALAVERRFGREQVVDGQSAARNGRPLANSKMCWFKPRRRRRPVMQRAASWISCKASRGSTRSGRFPVQPHTRSQAPSRSNSGASSHTPARLPMTLSARNCRTPFSMLRGSQGMGLVRVLVACVSSGGLRIGAVAIEFFFEGHTFR